MTDFSKYFTDPDAQAYAPDTHESAMWQQSSTNPFAVLHAIAARRNANSRREQYGEQLAAHDQRAVAGGRQMMQDENKYNTIQELIKQRMIDPGMGADLSDLRTAGNSQGFDELSSLHRAEMQGSALQKQGAGFKDFRAAGGSPTNMSAATLNAGVGDLAEVATTGEREQEARGRNDAKLPFKKNIIEPRPDANGNMITYQESYGTREEMLGQPTPSEPAPVKTGGGFTHAGKPNKNAQPAPGMQQPASVKRNAPGQAPPAITPGKLTADAMATRPAPQMNIMAKLKRNGIPTSNGTFMFVPNSLEIDEEGNVTGVFRLQGNGQVTETIVQVAPDGKYRTN